MNQNGYANTSDGNMEEDKRTGIRAQEAQLIGMRDEVININLTFTLAAEWQHFRKNSSAHLMLKTSHSH
ncbi:hypothetical protein PsorP6_010047 [Peronosclerospora sorghi]|uniref:Uncharacterized protein n=1 Tax=Peronosclerospora sorghi TaxID=230839 RepID=A0ACC0VV44_9STRA|nr:hypothetical protein PsorP6_010047 [Peronosclerospora sorghi]